MFARYLREFRKKHKMTQKELAELVGLSPSTIGMYEQGRREPDSATLQKISAVFNIPVDYLLGGESNRPPKSIEDAIEQFKSTLLTVDSLMFKGVPLKKNDIERLINAIYISANILLGT